MHLLSKRSKKKKYFFLEDHELFDWLNKKKIKKLHILIVFYTGKWNINFFWNIFNRQKWKCFVTLQPSHMIKNQSIFFHMSHSQRKRKIWLPMIQACNDHKLLFDWLNKKQILHIMTVQDSEILIFYQSLISEYWMHCIWAKKNILTTKKANYQLEEHFFF